MSRAARVLAAMSALLLTACSVRKLAVHSIGNALAGGTPSLATDDDPELVWAAVPFGLKTIEGLLEESPRDKGLLGAAAGGFTQYAYGSLQQDADFIEAADLARATALRSRARRLYLRALGYGLRGLEVDFPGFGAALRRDASAALASTRRQHVRLLYWTAAAWAAAIGLAVDDAELSADQDLAEAIMRRALALDEAWEWGAIHDFFVAWEAAHASTRGSYERAKQHYDKAVALSRGLRAWPMVNYAEKVALPRQDRAAFRAALEQALAVPPAGIKAQTLRNVLAQRRARWLLARADELFVEQAHEFDRGCGS